MEKSLNAYMRQVYLYMLIAIVVTGASALLAIHVFGVVLMSLPAFLVMIAVQLLLVTLIARQISSNSLSKHQIIALFLGFTVLEGVTLSPILALAPTQGVVMATVSSVVLFVVLSMIGLTTKRDLSGWGTMLMASLIAIIIVSLLSLFFIHVTMLMTIISIVSVILFAGFIVYDSQQIKACYLNGDNENDDVTAIYGALSLYLDFVNLFINLLRLFSNSR